MRTFIIILTIILVGAGIIVFSILNRPINFAIRQGFKQLTGLAVVKSDAFERMIEQNKLYKADIAEVQKAMKDLEKEREKDEKELKDLQAANSDLSKELAKSKQDLYIAEQLFQALGIDDHIKMFDQRTDGVKPTELISVMGEELAAVEPDRIRSANILIREGEIAKGIVEVHEKIVHNKRGQIQKLEHINTNLRLTTTKSQEEAALYQIQYRNCEAAKDEIMREAERKARTGIGVGSGMLLLSIILLLL